MAPQNACKRTSKITFWHPSSLPSRQHPSGSIWGPFWSLYEAHLSTMLAPFGHHLATIWSSFRLRFVRCGFRLGLLVSISFCVCVCVIPRPPRKFGLHLDFRSEPTLAPFKLHLGAPSLQKFDSLINCQPIQKELIFGGFVKRTERFEKVPRNVVSHFS